MRHFLGEATKMRKLPPICKGSLAEYLVAIELSARGFYVVEGGEGQVDWLAITVEDNVEDNVEDKRLKYPLEVKGVEVIAQLVGRHGTEIRESKIKGEDGPFFIIVVETQTSESKGASYYSCLIFTYPQMKSFLQEKKVKLYNSRYGFSIPREDLQNDPDYEKYYEKWSKITGRKEDDLNPDEITILRQGKNDRRV